VPTFVEPNALDVVLEKNRRAMNYMIMEPETPKELSAAEKKIAENIHAVLGHLGEDPNRQGLLKTPERVAKAYTFITQGYQQDARKILRSAMFDEDYSEMVLVKDIELYSLCEHHMLPFFGKAHIAYIPDGKIVGLSKIPRIVDVFARRLQVQERLTIEVRDAIQETLNPMGVAVVIEASHLCMQMRGVSKQNSVTTTSAFSGVFLEDHKTRKEFISLIGSKLSYECRIIVL
jgi:GTP cyclohydrolase I